jgi:formamidopyrimidine-DNA glycosylase
MKWFAVLAAAVFCFALAETVLQGGSSDATSMQNSDVFTPASPTIFEAARDFFGIHPKTTQPIAFTHKVHLAKGLPCDSCHAAVNRSSEAGLPSVRFCMSCHQAIATDRPEIKKIAAYRARGEEIPWVRVYDYSPTAHVKFNHAPHVRAGVQCSACHGDLREQTTAQKSVNLTMGYCLDCHKQRQASTDCVTCHF